MACLFETNTDILTLECTTGTTTQSSLSFHGPLLCKGDDVYSFEYVPGCVGEIEVYCVLDSEIRTRIKVLDRSPKSNLDKDFRHDPNADTGKMGVTNRNSPGRNTVIPSPLMKLKNALQGAHPGRSQESLPSDCQHMASSQLSDDKGGSPGLKLSGSLFRRTPSKASDGPGEDTPPTVNSRRNIAHQNDDDDGNGSDTITQGSNYFEQQKRHQEKVITTDRLTKAVHGCNTTTMTKKDMKDHTNNASSKVVVTTKGPQHPTYTHTIYSQKVQVSLPPSVSTTSTVTSTRLTKSDENEYTSLTPTSTATPQDADPDGALPTIGRVVYMSLAAFSPRSIRVAPFRYVTPCPFFFSL